MKIESYEIKDLQVKKLVIIGRLLIPILKKENSPLILLEKGKNSQPVLEDVKDHPYKMEVIKCGVGVEEFFPEGIKEGDVLYIDRHFGDGDFMNYNGELYLKILVHNVVSVLPKEKMPNHLKRYKELPQGQSSNLKIIN